MTIHLNPNSAGRWVNCPGSVALVAYNRLPDQNRTDADDGIMAHSIACDMLNGRVYDTSDSDMVDGASLYCDTVNDYMPDKIKRIIEGYVTAPSIHKECGGVPDIWYFDRKKLVIIDYKYGHRYVDAFENWQLIAYAAGCLDNIICDGGDLEINLIIVQPRSYCKEGPVRVWKTSAVALEPYFEKLRAVAIETQKPAALCQTGEQCYKCPAAHVCVALQQSAYIAAELSSSEALTLTDDALGIELNLLMCAEHNLKTRRVGLEEDAVYRINTGRRVAGFTLESSAGSLKWAQPDAEIISIGAVMGVHLANVKVITPTQALKKGLLSELVDSLSKRVSGAEKLVRIDKKLTKIFDASVKM